MHLPYKSVTGRHTYVIYLMFFNIHAYLGFIQFINFSVWPAEMGKIKADVNVLPPFKCSATSCKAWNQRRKYRCRRHSESEFRVCPGRVPPFHPEELCPSQVRGSLQPASVKVQARKTWYLTGGLEEIPKGMVPVQEMTRNMGQCQPVLNVPPSSTSAPVPSSQEFPRRVFFRNLTAF